MRGAGPGIPPQGAGAHPLSSYGYAAGLLQLIESRAARVMEGTQWMHFHDDGAARLGRKRCVGRRTQAMRDSVTSSISYALAKPRSRATWLRWRTATSTRNTISA